MDFSLSDEQRDIKRAAAEFAKGEFKPEVAQDCELNHLFPREIYKRAG
jgi:alkylation response protein AidB-like acyl-CoA dehydrogenase